MTAPGTVYLVGAGPGDPGLITVRGLEILKASDAVVFDSLAPHRLLEEARSDALLIDAGKRRGNHHMSQDEINAELISLAKSGKTVCRLKGGDPFVFGRGGEEALALEDAGITWEVVPGITSPIAAPAYAGIPITQRGMASSLTIVTGSEDPDKPDSLLDWKSLATTGGTLAFVMGWKGMPRITSALIENGLPATTPSALVQWGTTPSQNSVTGELGNIVEVGLAAGIAAPVILVVGEVASLRERLKWFDSRPLFGQRVLVTRARSQASRLATRLEDLGASTVQVPTIEIRPVDDPTELDDAVQALSGYDWLTFTSSNAVEQLWKRVEAAGLDGRAFHGVQIAAVGPSTARALAAHGLTADLVPDNFDADALIKRFKALPEMPKRMLFPRSEIGRESIVETLGQLGVDVQPVTAYRTVIADSSTEEARAALEQGVDISTFTSSSSVDNLVKLLDGDVSLINATRVACIGPITEETARSHGIEIEITATEQNINGLVAAIVESMPARTEA